MMIQTDTVTGICQALDSFFEEEYPIITRKIPNGANHSFRVLRTNNSVTKDIGWRYWHEQTFDIMFFLDEEDTDEDEDAISEKMCFALEDIEVDGKVVHGTNISHTTVDRVIHFSVTYRVFLKKDVPVIDKMSSLKTTESTKEA